MYPWESWPGCSWGCSVCKKLEASDYTGTKPALLGHIYTPSRPNWALFRVESVSTSTNFRVCTWHVVVWQWQSHVSGWDVNFYHHLVGREAASRGCLPLIPGLNKRLQKLSPDLFSFFPFIPYQHCFTKLCADTWTRNSSRPRGHRAAEEHQKVSVYHQPFTGTWPGRLWKKLNIL